MLHILCTNSSRYKEQLDKLCHFVGIKDYMIMDPASYEMSRSFKYLLLVGRAKSIPKASQLWQVPLPEVDMDKDGKLEIVDTFQKMQKFILSRYEKPLVEAADLPRLKDLEEFFGDYHGQVMELRLTDGRLIGIYPDGERLAMKYSTEFHVSTILNMSKIKEMFDVQRIIVKDL